MFKISIQYINWKVLSFLSQTTSFEKISFFEQHLIFDSITESVKSKNSIARREQENKEKLEVSFSHARTTRNEQKQHAQWSPYSLHTDTACKRVCRYPPLQSEHTGSP